MIQVSEDGWHTVLLTAALTPWHARLQSAAASIEKPVTFLGASDITYTDHVPKG